MPGLIMTNILRSVSLVGGEGVLSASASKQVCTMARFDHDQHFEECVRGGGEQGCYQRALASKCLQRPGLS